MTINFKYLILFVLFCFITSGLIAQENKDTARYSNTKSLIDSIFTLTQYNELKEKGDLFLHLSVPYINSFKFKPENEGTKIKTGFFGIKTGLMYYYSKNRFLSFSGSVAIDFFMPIPVHVDYSGERELISTAYLSFANNHTYKRITFAYGLSYSINSWSFIYEDRFDPPPPSREPVRKAYIAYGFIFQSYFYINDYIKFGFIYRPTFVRPDLSVKFNYEHLISFDLALNIPLCK